MLHVNDVVVGIGSHLRVASTELLREELREIVELKTRHACHQVTADHRIVIPCDESPCGKTDIVAKALRVGDLVFCGEQASKLVKVTSHFLRTEVVRLQFDPDEPVESFIAPKWGLLSKGCKVDHDGFSICNTDDGF